MRIIKDIFVVTLVILSFITAFVIHGILSPCFSNKITIIEINDINTHFKNIFDNNLNIKCDFVYNDHFSRFFVIATPSSEIFNNFSNLEFNTKLNKYASSQEFLLKEIEKYDNYFFKEIPEWKEYFYNLIKNNFIEIAPEKIIVFSIKDRHIETLFAYNKTSNKLILICEYVPLQ